MAPSRTLSPLVTLALLVLGCGGGSEQEPVGGDPSSASDAPAAAPAPAASSQQTQTWIRYTVSGDFEGEGTDPDLVLCSEVDEGTLVAGRGAWTIDLELAGSGEGEWSGSVQVTVPEGLPGAPSSVFARRMKGDGTFTIRSLGTDAMGFRRIGLDFAGSGLENEAGQHLDISGSAECLIF